MMKVLAEIAARLEAVSGQVDLTKASIAEHSTSEKTAMEEIGQKLAVLSSSVEHHEMAIDDLLDEWEDRRSMEENLAQHVAKEKELCEERTRLLKLIMTYDIQIGIMKNAVQTSAEEDWAEQIAMMEKKLSGELAAARISRIGSSGDEVNYELHEVISIEDTSLSSLHGKIARVLENGYMHEGQVLKKARVSAYRYQLDPQTDGRNE